VTGFRPGGTADTLCQRGARKLRGYYTKSALMENKAGAGGLIAAQSMKRAATNGNVLQLTLASILAIEASVPGLLRCFPDT
jgi:tripartite-type tricarboxylate transporter receptor subunit TctC